MARPTGAATAGRKAKLALFDSATLLGRGVKDQLIERSFPVGSMRLFSSRTDPEANLSEFGGEAMLVTRPELEDIGAIDIAFLCGTPPEGALYLDWPRRKGFVAIDLTAATRSVADVPLVNAGVNPEAMGEEPHLIASPHPIALMLSTVLAGIRRGCGLREAAAVVLQPVSEGGEEGIAELYRQTIALMNFQEVSREVFGRQVAFNLIPDIVVGPADVAGVTEAQALESEVSRITGGGFPLSVAVLLAPVFHCHTAMARVVLPAGRGRDDLLRALGATEDVGGLLVFLLRSKPEEGSMPT